jgi:hypothetical protein
MPAFCHATPLPGNLKPITNHQSPLTTSHQSPKEEMQMGNAKEVTWGEVWQRLCEFVGEPKGTAYQALEVLGLPPGWITEQCSHKVGDDGLFVEDLAQAVGCNAGWLAGTDDNPAVIMSDAAHGFVDGWGRAVGYTPNTGLEGLIVALSALQATPLHEQVRILRVLSEYFPKVWAVRLSLCAMRIEQALGNIERDNRYLRYDLKKSVSPETTPNCTPGPAASPRAWESFRPLVGHGVN